MAAAQLSITVPGFSDVTGHTEYIIKSSVGDQQFTVQHRFSNFVELHDALASKIAKLPATFPVAKNMFNGEAVKRERVEKLQEYLRNVVRLSGEKPPIALLKFLKIDASVFAPPSERSERGIATGDGPYPSSSEPLQRFQPFSGVNAAFVPERPEDVNEALREGLKAGDDALCKELIESKADPLYRDRQGNTPLHMACLFNRTDVAKLLLMAGADMTAKNAAGELPERMASVSLKMKFTHFKRTGTI
ncbi:ankyrin repeat family protein [Chrysochromulina tobinii]|uniref:Ankyrin repeat family protein n=1 Tax=Chrysochromulina tobinii TaxID=1460289 RepID=A0A0M0JCI1_9EUKA|nr:ankyrin repeat family protein [Chrysochromulina tobinii]|eukprot:KOO24180.1 ankyrin repeat family protein [Chrysochromulina sp. CCMP291]